MIISTIPEIQTNLLIMKKVELVNKKAIIIVVSHQIEEAERMYEEGATYVILPDYLGGKHFSTLLERNKLKMNKFIEEKIAHLEHIKNRKNIGHKHIFSYSN